MNRCDRALIDAHFAHRIRPNAERPMREHLVDCDDCRAYYERHLLVARLSPRAPSARDRIAAGLGLASRKPERRRWWWLALPTLAAAGLAVIMTLPVSPVARGGRVKAEPVLFAYRLGGESSKGHPLITGAAIAASGELAFAYQNPTRFQYLMVFASDEHRHVYWYHPAWHDAASDPGAVAIENATAPHELEDAVAHVLDGKTLRVWGLFSRSRSTVKQIEARLASGPLTAQPDEQLISIDLRVEGSATR